MAFNPFKNIKIDDSNAFGPEPTEPTTPLIQKTIQTVKSPSTVVTANTINNSEENKSNVNNLHPAIKDNVENEYEGTPLEELEQIGMKTISLLKVASNNVVDRQHYNTKVLESIPLLFVMQELNIQNKYNNVFSLTLHGKEYEIAIDEQQNRWYNKTIRKGHVKAISLVKHITAIQEDLDEVENDTNLFINACKKLNEMFNKDTSLQQVSESTNIKQNVAPEKEKPVSENKNQVPNNTPIDWKAINEHLKSISLVSLMEYLGASANQDNTRGKWKVYQINDNIQVTGQKWWNFNAQEGGIGSLSCMQHVLAKQNNANLKDDGERKAIYKMAVKELMREFGGNVDLRHISSGDEAINFKEPFAMPHVIDFKIHEVKTYLHEKRGLPMWIINKQINAGHLFAGYPSDWLANDEKNKKILAEINNPSKLENNNVWACFLSANGTAAEMRGIDRHDQFAKLLAKGSDKDLGGFVIRAENNCNEKAVSCLEAAIDTMSYHAFYPGRIAMSCMGVGYNLAVKACLEALNVDAKFYLAFDNDRAGNEAAVAFKKALIEEIGEEEYIESVEKSLINYFDLATKCLIQTVKAKETFYFDVKNNEEGKEAVKMFIEQIKKIIPEDQLKLINQQNKIKYINVFPDFGTFRDVDEKVQETISLLNSNKPYYLRFSIPEDEKPDLKKQREEYTHKLKTLAADKFKNWESEGKIIYNKNVLAKDWNEFFNHMKKDERFCERLDTLENTYLYSHKKNKTVASKKP